MPIPLRLRFILFTTLRWTAAWAAIGLLFGIAMTLGRVPPIAEPGAPSGYWFYTFWIPICLGVASVLGAILGLLYACLMAAIGHWVLREPVQRGFIATYGWPMLSGAAAGALIGFPLMHDWSALWVVGMGLGSGSVSGFLNRPKARPLEPEPGRTK